MRGVLGFLAFAAAIIVCSVRAGAAQVKVACVGDSITEHSGWCEVLATRLGPRYAVHNFGESGRTLLKAGDFPYWESAKFSPSHDLGPDLVVIMLGTNDSKPQNWTAAKKARFVPDYEGLIDSYAGLASHPRILVALPPPSGRNGFGISGEVIETEELPLIRTVAAAKGVGLVDVFGAFGGHGFDTALFGTPTDQSDQVHPNAKGAQVIADTVYAALTSAAQSQRGVSPEVHPTGSVTSRVRAPTARKVELLLHSSSAQALSRRRCRGFVATGGHLARGQSSPVLAAFYCLVCKASRYGTAGLLSRSRNEL